MHMLRIEQVNGRWGQLWGMTPGGVVNTKAQQRQSAVPGH